MEQRWNETDRGKPKYSGEKTCHSATLSTTNPIWIDPKSNLGLRCERLATNRLSHGTVFLGGYWRFGGHFCFPQDGQEKLSLDTHSGKRLNFLKFSLNFLFEKANSRMCMYAVLNSLISEGQTCS
jgi:hypothetical protein